MLTEHTAASTYVQISREELEDWLDDIGFRGKWDRDTRFAGVYLLALSNAVAVKLSSTIGSQDDAMGRGKASMQLALISRLNGRVVNKKAQGQSHFARTKGWKKNWDEGINTMKRTYLTASDFYDVIAAIEDRDKYQQDILKQIEGIPGWSSNNFFISLHRKVERGGVVMPNERREIEKGLATPAARPDPQTTHPVSKEEPPEESEKAVQEALLADDRLNAVRDLWVKANRWQPQDERGDANKKWVMDFARSIGTQLKNGRTLSPAQVTTLRRNLDSWKVESNGQPASKLF